MNIFLIVSLCIFTIMDSILIKRYERKIKNLTNENKDLKKVVSSLQGQGV